MQILQKLINYINNHNIMNKYSKNKLNKKVETLKHLVVLKGFYNNNHNKNNKKINHKNLLINK